MTGFSAIPLAENGTDDDVGNGQQFKGVSRIRGPPWLHLPTLTVGLLGVQIFWSVEMSYASPYLLSLGLTKSNMAIVFVAGPLSGLIMQPLIGVLADSSTSRFGRRRPYMLLGTGICMLAMLLLGYTRPFASVFTGRDNHSNDVLTIWLAVLAIYLIDFSINAVQAVDRALLVDTLPHSEQAQGNAWAARMLGMGSVVGFFVGNLNLPRFLPFLGKSQLEVLSVVVSLLLLAGHVIMAVTVKERVLVATQSVSGKSHKKSFVGELKAIWTNIIGLPRVIRQICIIQFFAWLAWFPTLFYSTIYVGDLYKRTVAVPSSPFSPEEQADMDSEATRLGSRALFYSSVLALVGNLVLPAFVVEGHTSGADGGGRQGLTGGAQTGEREPWWERMCRVPRSMRLHLATMWAISHAVFAGCMAATFFTHSVFGATVLITITGFSWAITQWAPFSLLAEAILTEPASSDDTGSIRLADTRTRPQSSLDQEREVFLPGREHHEQEDVDSADEDDEDKQLREEREERRRALGSSGAQTSRININGGLDGRGEYEDLGRPRGGGLSAKAGIILGIHNIFIVLPQFLITGLSAIVFAIFDPQKSVLPEHHGSANAPGTVASGNGTVPGNATVLALENATASIGEVAGKNLSALLRNIVPRDDEELGERQGTSNSVVYVFRFGGLAATIAFVLCWRLARELRHR